MIGMVLIFLFGIYLFLFLLVGIKSKNWTARMIGWGALLAPLLWLTWDIPVGHYKFKKLCEREGGIRIFVKNPKPAKRIRLEGNEFCYANAETYFQFYPSLQQIEAKDKEYSYVSNPTAYALYERDGNGKMVSKLMDVVDKTGPETRVAYSAPSKAEYFMSYEIKEYPYRTTLYRYILRSADNTVIGTVTNIYHAWSVPEHTLLGRPFNVQYCGSDKEYELIQLIAPKGR